MLLLGVGSGSATQPAPAGHRALAAANLLLLRTGAACLPAIMAVAVACKTKKQPIINAAWFSCFTDWLLASMLSSGTCCCSARFKRWTPSSAFQGKGERASSQFRESLNKATGLQFPVEHAWHSAHFQVKTFAISIRSCAGNAGGV